MKVLLVALFGTFSMVCFSQDVEKDIVTENDSISVANVSLYKTIQNKSVSQFIGENYNYPQEAFREGITGTISAEFVVEKDGTVKNVVIKKGLCTACDKEAVRVLKTIRMNPVEIDGEIMRIRFKIPIRLTLQE